MAKLWSIVLLVLATCGVVVKGGDPPLPSSSPNTDCSDLIYNMVDCVSFLSEGNEERLPDGSCCSGFETVLSARPECICGALATSGSMGIELSLAKAITLPAACGLSAPSLSKCGAIPPSGSSPIPTGTLEEAPAPSPLASMASSTATSFTLISFAVASLSYILA